MSGPFVEYVWAAYAVSIVALGLTVVATLMAYRNARRAVQDSETKP
jgi:heme exporter protein CcmD